MCRKPVRAVGESPVMLSPLANVFVSLSSVRSECFAVCNGNSTNQLCLLCSVACWNTHKTDHDLTIVILPWVISRLSVSVSAPLSLDVHVHVATNFVQDNETTKVARNGSSSSDSTIRVGLWFHVTVYSMSTVLR